MIKLKKLLNEIADMIHTPPAHIQTVSNESYSSDFINYIKFIENGGHVGFNKNKKLWFPYKDPTGWHIGYGHKIINDAELNNLNKGVNDAVINKLLTSDLIKANKIVNDYIKTKYKVNLQLQPKQREMLIDFAFNLGTLHTFPKFVDAVLKNDTTIINKEYKRHAAGKEIKGRNDAFYNRFLK